MAQTRLTPEVDLDGLSPDEAFSVLGEETRLDIIRILWEAGAMYEYDDIDDSSGEMSFSDLRRGVELEDNGQFNYHLSKLVPHFVRQTEDGYRLSGAGKKIARTVVAISGEPGPAFSDEVDIDCPLCGAPVAAAYEDQWLRYSCTKCKGLFGDAAPEGSVLNTAFPAAGMADRDPEDALTAGLYRCILDLNYLNQGVCRECASPVTISVSICEDHGAEASRPCETCGSPFPVWVEYRCECCRFAKRLPIEFCLVGTAPVFGFLSERDDDALPPDLHDMVDFVRSGIRASVERDPLRVTAEISVASDELTVTYDEELTPLEVIR